MIKANELRRGNWVTVKDKLPKQVYAISRSHILIARDDNSFYELGYDLEQDVYPIPLTPEILEKCGLKPNKYSVEGHQFDEPFYDIELEAKGWLINWDHTSGWFIAPVTSQYNVTPIKYLHQLQNLYFALTGKELEVSL